MCHSVLLGGPKPTKNPTNAPTRISARARLIHPSWGRLAHHKNPGSVRWDGGKMLCSVVNENSNECTWLSCVLRIRRDDDDDDDGDDDAVQAIPRQGNGVEFLCTKSTRQNIQQTHKSIHTQTHAVNSTRTVHTNKHTHTKNNSNKYTSLRCVLCAEATRKLLERYSCSYVRYISGLGSISIGEIVQWPSDFKDYQPF